tara:strand:+ start:12861 stop:16208 length:3348 start_codon:yes stop_codon:yes gene_type:complete
MSIIPKATAVARRVLAEAKDDAAVAAAREGAPAPSTFKTIVAPPETPAGDQLIAGTRLPVIATLIAGGKAAEANLPDIGPDADPFDELEKYDNAELMASLSGLDPMHFADTDTVIDDNGEEVTYGLIGRDTDDELAIRLNSVEQPPEDQGALAQLRQQSQQAGEDYQAKHTENAALAFEESDAFPPEDESFAQQFGETLGNINVGLSALPSDIAAGFGRLLSNAWGAFFPEHQANIDKLWNDHEDFRNQTMKDHPVADIAGSVAGIGSQLVFPAIAGRNMLVKAGMNPIVATVAAESLTGFLAFSPKDATIINDLIDADEDDKTLKTIRDLLATDPGNESAYAARGKQAFEAMALLGLGEVAIRGIIKTVTAANAFAKTGPGRAVLAMAAAAGITTPADAEAGGLSKFFGLAKRVLGPDASLSPSQTGGLTFPAAESSERLRLKLQREAGVLEGKPMPGGPANDRRVIRAPKGSGLPNFVVGKVTPKDWITRTEKLLSPEEIGEAAKWYGKIRDMFLQHTQGDAELADAYMRGWLVTQQNIDVTGALNNLLLQAEQFARDVPVGQMRAGGMPNPTAAAQSVIQGKQIEGGVGQKISDFVDSGEGKSTRSWMGDDAAGGEPFVVDIHTARDTGLVDDVLVNHLRRLGYKEDDLADLGRDFSDSIAGTKYENRAQFGRDLTAHLNKNNWQGRSDWKPSEVQAVGWMAMTKLTAGQADDVATALERSTRRISYEAAPGVGSPWDQKFSARFYELSLADQAAITKPIADRAAEVASEVAGIDVRGVVHGTGGWTFEGEQAQNAAAVAQALSTGEGAEIAANTIGYLLQQTEVWSNSVKGMTKTPKGFAIDFVEKPGGKILTKVESQKAFWDEVVGADDTGLIGGYHPFTLADGRHGIRILVDKGGKKTGEKVLGLVQGTLTDVVKKSKYKVDVFGYEARITKAINDWRKTPDGRTYLARLADLGVTRSGTDFDSIRGELETIFEEGLSKAEAKAKGKGKGKEVKKKEVTKQTTVFDNPDVRGRAEDIATAVRSVLPGASVEVRHGGSAAGKSAYVAIRYRPEKSKRQIVTEFRVSDHGTGPNRHLDYDVHANVSEPTDLTAVLKKLSEAKVRVDDSVVN